MKGALLGYSNGLPRSRFEKQLEKKSRCLYVSKFNSENGLVYPHAPHVFPIGTIYIFLQMDELHEQSSSEVDELSLLEF
jgi:hypothetical protein